MNLVYSKFNHISNSLFLIFSLSFLSSDLKLYILHRLFYHVYDFLFRLLSGCSLLKQPFIQPVYCAIQFIKGLGV